VLPASRESGDKGLAGPEISLNLCAVNAVGVNWWIWERRTALAVQSCIRVQCVLLIERAKHERRTDTAGRRPERAGMAGC
jgi:hypothetical protein